MESVRIYKEDSRTSDVWADYFGIGGSTPRYTTFEVIRNLNLLSDEIDRAEELAESSRITEERYSSSLQRIRAAVQPSNVAAQWQQYKRQYGESDINMLRTISDVSDDENDVSEESLDDFKNAVEEFRQHVATLEDDTLCKFATSQLLNMERAISDYPIIGARAFEQGVKDFAGEAFFSYDVWKKNEGTETIDRMRNLGGKLFNIVKYTAPAIQAAAGMKELLGL
jgi:hypothetical protein